MTKEKNKLVRKNIVLTERVDEMVEKIKQEKGLKSFVSVIELAIDVLYSKTFKDYVMQRSISGKKTPEERAEEQLRIVEIKKQKVKDVQLDILTRLGGRLNTQSGSDIAEYMVYDRKNRFLQEVPLTMLNEDMVKDQYFPSREDVEARQKKGEVNYDVNSWTA